MNCLFRAVHIKTLLILLVAAQVVAMTVYAINDWSFRRPQIQSTQHQTLGRVDPAAPCGVTSLFLCALFFQQQKTLDDCRSAIDCDALGRSSMASLATGFASFGLHAKGCVLTTLPARLGDTALIVHLRRSHWATVIENSRGCLVLLDPPSSPVAAHGSNLMRTWDGTCLVVGSSEGSVNAFLSK